MSILDFDRLLFNKKKPSGILLGHNAITGEPVYLNEDDRKVHEHVLGNSGTGKSKLVELQIRQDIKAGRGLLLIDPVGDLSDDILAYVSRNHLGHKLIYFDPNDERYSVGLNRLEFDPSIRSSTTHVSETMRGIAKVFDEENIDAMPQLQRWERNLLLALTEAKLTLTEISLFMRYASVRNYILTSVGHQEVKDEWEYFNNTTKTTQEAYSGALFNRANKFVIGQNVRRIFGQDRTTIDLSEAMDEGKIVLCNLARKKISEEEQKLLAVTIIDKVVQAGLARASQPSYKRRPFYVYMDEFGLFTSNDIAVALWELRKFNVRFVLINQELRQIDDEKLLSAVLAEPQVKVAFRISRGDAEIMMKEMFAGMVNGDQIKFDLYIKSQFHRETTRTVKQNSATHSDQKGKGSGGGAGTSQIPSAGWERPDADKNITSFNESSSEFDSEGSGDGYSYGETIVPFLEPYEVEQLSSRTFYSLDEMREKFISWLQKQPDRHAIIKIGNEDPIPVSIAKVKPAKASDYEIEKAKQISNKEYALPSEEADKLIEERRVKILEEAQEITSLPVRKKVVKS